MKRDSRSKQGGKKRVGRGVKYKRLPLLSAKREDYIITMAPVKGWDILASSEQSVLELCVLETGQIDTQIKI